jgi:hypothetical protein
MVRRLRQFDSLVEEHHAVANREGLRHENHSLADQFPTISSNIRPRHNCFFLLVL